MSERRYRATPKEYHNFDYDYDYEHEHERTPHFGPRTSALRHFGTSHDAGVSLLELIAALFVFTIGLLGSLKMYDVTIDKVRAMREADIAVCALQNEMETMRAMPFESLTERAGAPFVSHTPDMDQLVQVTPTVDVRPYGDPVLALKEVRASVRWRGDNGRVIEKTLTTLIGKREAGGT